MDWLRKTSHVCKQLTKMFFFNFQINFHRSKKLGGAIALPAPPVDPPLLQICLNFQNLCIYLFVCIKIINVIFFSSAHGIVEVVIVLVICTVKFHEQER